MKKRDPLSTPETMRPPASPRLQPSRPGCPGGGFSGGLVGGFSGPFNVSAVDTFVEKPFSVLALWTLSNCGNLLASNGNHGARPVCCLVDQWDHYARAFWAQTPTWPVVFVFRCGAGLSRGGSRWGAGRPAYRVKAELVQRVDVRQWARRGLLAGSASFTWTWSRGGDPAGSIGVVVDSGQCLTLRYATTDTGHGVTLCSGWSCWRPGATWAACGAGLLALAVGGVLRCCICGGGGSPVGRASGWPMRRSPRMSWAGSGASKPRSRRGWVMRGNGPRA